MKVALRRLLRAMLVQIGRLLCYTLFNVTIEGKEHLPKDPTKLLVISNHFSWFDAPIISLLLPFPPAYLIATEAMDKAWINGFTRIFESIPIWRGQVDRKAMTTAVRRLRDGGVVGIFPEGGINPELSDAVASGQQIDELGGNMARGDGTLIRAKSGVALLATMSGAEILPLALLNSQHILENLRQLRRTPLTLRVGPTFGPLTLPNSAKGLARRQLVDQLTTEMMLHIAALLPPEKRGYYADLSPPAANQLPTVD